jgi:hypothetical protein
LSTIDIFEDEKRFKKEFDFLERYSTERPNEYEYIDFSYDQTFYGRIDSQGDTVELKENNCRLLEGGSGDVWAVNFVADAFTEFRNYMKTAIYYNKVNTNASSYYTSLAPIKGWQSLKNLYNIHMNKLYENFVGSYMKKRGRNKRITDFKSFMQVFMEYVEQLTPEIPFTKTGFARSKKCPPHVGGLMIELSKFDRDDLRRREQMYDDPNYKFFRNTARKFGFYIDKNAPWTLVANLNSGYKYKVKPFPSQTNFPDRLAESGMAPHIKKYVNDGLTVHEQLYFKTHLGDEWDNLNGGDMVALRHYLFQFYTSFVAASPYILHNPEHHAVVVGHGPQMRIRHSSRKKPLIKFYRENLGQVDQYGGMPDAYIERYGPKFWLMIYTRMRFAEADMKLNLQKEYHDVIKVLQYESLYHAMEHINNRTKGHSKTKFNILGGKKWHDKNQEPEKNTPKRMKIVSPTGKVIETDTRTQSVESTPAPVSTIISSGGTATSTGGGTFGGGY